MINARRLNATVDTTLGSLLAIAAIVFGVIGFWSGLAGNSHSNGWYLAGITLGVLAGILLLDELSARRSDRRFDAVLGTLLMLGALGMGTVGWILNMADVSTTMTWQLCGLILAILSMAAAVDELRRLHTLGTDREGSFSALAVLFGLLAIGLGVVGFIVGLAGGAHALTWLIGGVLSSVIAVAWDFEAEHREVLASTPTREPIAPMGTTETTMRP